MRRKKGLMCAGILGLRRGESSGLGRISQIVKSVGIDL